MNGVTRLIMSLMGMALLNGCVVLGPISPLRPLERKLVFPTGTAHPRGGLPADGSTEAEFTTSDGIRLHGRFFAHPQPRAVALFCHGNAGSVDDWSEVGQQLKERYRIAVLVFDYRGYGKSEGSPTEAGVLLDAQAARRWLSNSSGVAEADLLIIGRSLGGAVAVDLAVNGGARGLVLESTFSSLPDVAATHVPWLLPHLMMTQRLNSASKIRNYRGPLLQCHGDQDELISLTLAKKLHAAAPGQKKFVVIPGAGHINAENEEYRLALDEFIERLPAVKVP